MDRKNLENVALSLRLSRYTFLRYMISIEFFIFLYWIISDILSKNFYGIILPLSLAFLMIYISKEIFFIIKNQKDEKIISIIKIFKLSLLILSITFIGLIINHELVFPYLNSKGFSLGLISIVILIMILSLKNALKIRDKKDKIYKRYKEYESKQNKKDKERIKYV